MQILNEQELTTQDFNETFHDPFSPFGNNDRIAHNDTYEYPIEEEEEMEPDSQLLLQKRRGVRKKRGARKSLRRNHFLRRSLAWLSAARERLCHPTSRFHSYLLMVLISLVSTGAYFAYDATSPLEEEIVQDFNISGFQFNLLYVVYSLPNAIMPFFGGYFIDKVGTSRGMIILGMCVLVGSTMVSLGASSFIHSYPLLLFGRFVFGLGSESLVVAQTCVLSEWFKDKMLSTAIGILEMISHLGTAGAFIFVPMILKSESNSSTSYSDNGNSNDDTGSTSYSNNGSNIARDASYADALWLSTFLCLASFWCSLGYFYLAQRARHLIASDHKSDSIPFSLRSIDQGSFGVIMHKKESNDGISRKEENEEGGGGGGGGGGGEEEEEEEEDVREGEGIWDHFKEVKRFPATFWMACIQSALFYGSIFPFGAVATEFFMEKYNTSKQVAGAITSIITLSPIVVSSISGTGIDSLGRRLSFVVIGSLFMVPGFSILCFCDPEYGYAIGSILLLGIGYSITPVALYPIIAASVNDQQAGIAFGVEASCLNITYMVVNLLVGSIKKYSGDTKYMLLFLTLSCFSCVVSICWLITDSWRKAGANIPNPNRQWSFTRFLFRRTSSATTKKQTDMFSSHATQQECHSLTSLDSGLVLASDIPLRDIVP